jgi:hypothetical protein
MARSIGWAMLVGACLMACGGGGTSSADGGSRHEAGGGADGESGDASGHCSTSAQCGSGGVCQPGGGTAGCGACFPGNCMTDADCKADAAPGSHVICGFPGCICGAQKGVCTAACTGGSCGIAEACAASGHCEAKPCKSSTDCPKYYACGAQGTCALKTCSTDSDCGGGYCVNESCASEPGACAGLAP